MGIHGFTTAFDGAGHATLKTIEGMKLAIDAYIEVYRTSGMQHKTGLTNPVGEGTQHIRSILSNVCRMLELKIEAVWCIDSREPPTEKKATLDERKAARDNMAESVSKMRDELVLIEEKSRSLTSEQMAMIDPSFSKTLERKRAELATAESRILKPGQFNRYMTDLMYILNGLGIAYSVAPNGIEAEQLGAYLCYIGITDGVLTTDTDALVYGAQWIMKKRVGETGKYDLYRLDIILEKTGLTREQFVRACVALGCDYDPGIRGVGPKTVVQKIKNEELKFTENQEAIISKFMIMPTFTPVISRPIRTPESIAKLRQWLIEEQGFGAERLDKLFAKI
jgi:5'-3' exonuclease